MPTIDSSWSGDGPQSWFLTAVRRQLTATTPPNLGTLLRLHDLLSFKASARVASGPAWSATVRLLESELARRGMPLKRIVTDHRP
jgi:hypothetical protein